MHSLLQNIVTVALTVEDAHLSWQELGQNLVQLRDSLLTSEPDLTLRQAEIMMLGTRMPSLPLARTRIAPSHHGGQGLFAAQDIVAGDLLTCYPGDIVVTPQGFAWPTAQPVEEGLVADTATLRDYLHRYCIGVIEEAATGAPEVAVLGLPELDGDAAYAGHFINDGIEHPPVIESDLERYVEESQSKANAEFLPLENLHLVALATRDVAKDEEIFAYYGPLYWMDHKSTWQGGSPSQVS